MHNIVTDRSPPREYPVVLFVQLTEALENGDYYAAARAADKLRAQGIDVRLRQPQEPREAGVPTHA